MVTYKLPLAISIGSSLLLDLDSPQLRPCSRKKTNKQKSKKRTQTLIKINICVYFTVQVSFEIDNDHGTQ